MQEDIIPTNDEDAWRQTGRAVTSLLGVAAYMTLRAIKRRFASAVIDTKGDYKK